MKWSRGKTIGHGSSATVSIATSNNNNNIFAVKSSELPNSEALQREQRILSSLCSPYVVTYKGCDITMEHNKLMYNLFMEYMPLGTLVEDTRRHSGRLDEPVIACYTRQIVKGLDYLHSIGLVHCDIKGANILIGEDGVKIGDFGCAKNVNDSSCLSGTPMFMSPEVVLGEEQGCPCDIWSLGCTMIEMAIGESPWPNVGDPFSVLYHIAYSDEVPNFPSFLSEEAKDFLGKCLRRNPHERWTASQLLKHPFLEEFSSNCKKVQESNSSSSPTSILEQGFWNSMVEEESGSINGNLVHTTCFENSPMDRVGSLALCSGVPCWSWHDDDGGGGNWITTRGDDVEAFENCGSVTGSTSDELDLQELVKSNVNGRISGCFCQDNKCRDVSVVGSYLNFERGISKMFIPSTFEFL